MLGARNETRRFVPLDLPTASPAIASPTARINRRAVFFFAALFALALAGFWPSYFAPPKPIAEARVHVHGLLMFGWLALLVAQAGLIRAERRALHRSLGRVSYVLAPLIVASTLWLLHLRLRQKIDAEMLYFLYVILAMTALFAGSYVLAMSNRRRPAIHARYMVCAALALVDPIMARILFFGAGIEPPVMQLATYALVNGLLAWLAYLDWKARNGIRVFPIMLAVFVAAQIPTFFVTRLAWWPDFARFLAALPLP